MGIANGSLMILLRVPVTVLTLDHFAMYRLLAHRRIVAILEHALWALTARVPASAIITTKELIVKLTIIIPTPPAVPPSHLEP